MHLLHSQVTSTHSYTLFSDSSRSTLSHISVPLRPLSSVAKDVIGLCLCARDQQDVSWPVASSRPLRAVLPRSFLLRTIGSPRGSLDFCPFGPPKAAVQRGLGTEYLCSPVFVVSFSSCLSGSGKTSRNPPQIAEMRQDFPAAHTPHKPTSHNTKQHTRQILFPSHPRSCLDGSSSAPATKQRKYTLNSSPYPKHSCGLCRLDFGY